MISTQTIRRWSAGTAAIAAFLALLPVLYTETIHYLAQNWNPWGRFEYGHGYLVIAISLYLVYVQRARLARLAPCPSAAALVALALSALLWLLAALASVQIAQVIALWLLLASFCWAMLGGGIMRRIAFPLLFLVFAIPVWSALLPGLQELTTDIVYRVVRQLGVPALRQGHVIFLPAGQIEISDACGGLRYLLAALTLGVLYAYLYYRVLWQRLLVVALAAGAAILANSLRIFIIVYLAYKTEMQHPLITDHLNMGWYLFAALILGLLLLDVFIHRHAKAAAASGPGESAGPAARACGQPVLRQLFVPVAAIALAVSGPAFMWRLQQQTAGAFPAVPQLPEGAGGWTRTPEIRDSWLPLYRGAIPAASAYARADDVVYVYVGYYPVQQQHSELVNDMNTIGDAVWHPVDRPRIVTGSGGREVMEQVLASESGVRRLVWYWYQVTGRETVNGFQVKLLQVLGSLAGRPEAAVIAVAADIDADAGAARTRLDDYVRGMGHSLQRLTDEHDRERGSL